MTQIKKRFIFTYVYEYVYCLHQGRQLNRCPIALGGEKANILNIILKILRRTKIFVTVIFSIFYLSKNYPEVGLCKVF